MASTPSQHRSEPPSLVESLLTSKYSTKPRSPAFGLTGEQLDGIYRLPAIEHTDAILSVMQSYYATLPCPEILSSLQRAANTWKMDVLIRADGLSSTHPVLNVQFTLWDEGQGRAFGQPGTAAAICLSSKSPLFITDEGEVDIIPTVGCLGMASFHEAFGRGDFYLQSPSKETKITPQSKTNLSVISAMRFKPRKLLLHDITLVEGLMALTASSRLKTESDKLLEFESIAVTPLVPLSVKEGNVRLHYMGVCATCRDMGVCGIKAGKGQLKSMSRCSSCCKRYYCNRKCQKEDWERHKLECKGKGCLKAKM